MDARDMGNNQSGEKPKTGQAGASPAAWEQFFAWWPVIVHAYHEDEIRNGKFRYRVWLRYVERRNEQWTDEDGIVINRIRHRLVRR